MQKRKVIDTHIHYWDPDRIAYPWLVSVPSIAHTHAPEQLQAQEGTTDRFQLDRIVFVQAGAADDESVREAHWIDGLAAVREPRIAGIVACASLDRGLEAAPELEALQALPRVKGIRRLIQGQGLGYAVTPDFIASVQSLPAYGFSFDLCIVHEQLADAITLVRACPDVSFILDHIGKADIKGGGLEPWSTRLRELAALPNVVCKLSGMVTEADMDNWTPADLQPYVDHVLECFGPDRVMYGGDWPVSLLGSRHWGHWVDTLDDLTAALDEDEKQKLFHDNAVRVYRL